MTPLCRLLIFWEHVVHDEHYSASREVSVAPAEPSVIILIADPHRLTNINTVPRQYPRAIFRCGADVLPCATLAQDRLPQLTARQTETRVCFRVLGYCRSSNPADTS